MNDFAENLDTEQRRFVALLARLVQPDRPDEASAALAKMLPMLGGFPLSVWKSRTVLDAVATCKRRTVVPSYADITAVFAAWLHDNPEPTLPLPGNLKPADWEWVRYFQRREAEGFSRIEGTPARSTPREHLLSLLRSQSKAAHDYVTGAAP